MNISLQSLLFPLAALLLAAALLLISRLIKNASGIPEGRIVYADPGLWGKPEKPFYPKNQLCRRVSGELGCAKLKDLNWHLFSQEGNIILLHGINAV